MKGCISEEKKSVMGSRSKMAENVKIDVIYVIIEVIIQLKILKYHNIKSRRMIYTVHKALIHRARQS